MKILLINGGAKLGHSGGELNRSLHELAKTTLIKLGHEIQETTIESGYDIEAEVNKFLWMDAVIWQMPGWWMGEPWIVKKYIDEVFTAGHGRLYANDGRTRSDDPTLGYGSGGLLGGKKHMLSLTWNAPLRAFDDPTQFFGGIGVDAVYLHFHKLNEFIGINKALDTFIVNDVIKAPDVPRYFLEYENHLKTVFKEA